MNTTTVSMAVTPTVVSTFFSHYFNRKPLKQRPTAHLSYDEGLHLIRSFLAFAQNHTVEDLQAFTAQWVPHPQWVKVESVEIPKDNVDKAALILQEQLGPDGIKRVGGTQWWQWRKPNRHLGAEWIEMRGDYHERKKTGGLGNRVMLYVHGGAYFFGSVDEHRYQMQRHARKLKARVFAPKYRLAPQFPFPCGLHDCLAAYLCLLSIQDPSTIILAGDSAGGGMVMSMLVTLRDRGIPLPAGAILISPWVDLTHSFPSVAEPSPMDYIPEFGFHHKPSKAWPPLNAEEHALLKEQIAKQTKLGQNKLMKPASVELKKKLSQDLGPYPKHATVGPQQSDHHAAAVLCAKIDGQDVSLKDQMQMYTTNELLTHPLVSPVLQPTLGGFPPLLIMVGGGEMLRDEQIYLAHKCANPSTYAPGDAFMDDVAREQLARYKPTDVQLQVWEDLCHVAPTLSFTRPAKYMYRAIAQFGAWALARAQNTEIDILDDDDISVISSSASDNENDEAPEVIKSPDSVHHQAVGKAGEEIPPFKNHMVRQHVSRHGIIRPLDPASDLVACNMDPNEIGVFKEVPVRKWLEQRRQMDNRYGSARVKVHKQRLKEMIAGYEGFDGDTPPPSALAGRRRVLGELADKKKAKGIGLSLWSLWGSKHDEMTVGREQAAEKAPDTKDVTAYTAPNETPSPARSRSIPRRDKASKKSLKSSHSRSRSKRRVVKYEHQIVDDDEAAPEELDATPLATLMAKRTSPQLPAGFKSSPGNLLTPSYVTHDHDHETGATGKRPIMEGISVPFTLNREAETASMITLNSAADGGSSHAMSLRPVSPFYEPNSPVVADDVGVEALAVELPSNEDRPVSPVVAAVDDMAEEEPVTAGTPRTKTPEPSANMSKGKMSEQGHLAYAHFVAANSDLRSAEEEAEARDTVSPSPVPPSIIVHSWPLAEERPPLEKFVTAEEALPLAK